MRMKGLEPPRPETSDPKSDAATITPHARNCVQSYDFLVKVQLLHAKNDCSTAETECREEARCAVCSSVGGKTEGDVLAVVAPPCGAAATSCKHLYVVWGAVHSCKAVVHGVVASHVVAGS